MERWKPLSIWSTISRVGVLMAVRQKSISGYIELLLYKDLRWSKNPASQSVRFYGDKGFNQCKSFTWEKSKRRGDIGVIPAAQAQTAASKLKDTCTLTCFEELLQMTRGWWCSINRSLYLGLTLIISL